MTTDTAIAICSAVAGLSALMLFYCIINIYKTIMDLKNGKARKNKPSDG